MLKDREAASLVDERLLDGRDGLVDFSEERERHRGRKKERCGSFVGGLGSYGHEGYPALSQRGESLGPDTTFLVAKVQRERNLPVLVSCG